MSNKNADYYFLSGGGEMGALIRAKDWSKTSLGDPADWPESLQTMVAVMLDNPFGMYIAWGGEYIQLYNDGYRPILGATKHPQALGISTRETFSEIWDNVIGSMFDDVMKGKAVGFPDFMLPLNRNGFVEECYFDFSYSPIRKNDGEVGGVLVTVIETTDKKKAQAALIENIDQFKFATDAAELGTWDYNPFTNKFTSNSRLKEWFGLPVDEQIELHHATNAIEEKDRQRIIDTIQQSLDYASGGNYTETFTIIHPITKSERLVQVRGKASFDEHKIAYRLNGTMEDVTNEVIALRKLEESETKLRLIIEQAPVAMCVFRGSHHIVEIANEKMLELWGRPATDVMNKPIFEGLPEAKGQGLEPIVDNVFKTGKTFEANERPVNLPRQGKIETTYINFVYEALKDINGAVSGIMAIASEVTTQVLARKKIEEKEEQLRIALEGGELGTFDYYPETDTLHWSDKTKEFFGLPPEADVNYNVYLNAIHPEDRNASKSIVQQKAKLLDGGFYELEYRTVGINDGRIRWVRSKGMVIYGVKNNPVRYTGVVQEITKRKEVEQALKESEERFRTITDNISQLAWMANEKGQMIWFNKRWLEYSGTTMEQMLKDGAKYIHHPAHRSRVMDKYLKAVKDGNEWEDTFPLLGADGQYRWFLSRAIPIKKADGKVKQWFGTNTDITQRMEAEEALKESEEKFRTMAESSDILIGVNDETINAVYFNKGWEKLTGRSVDELMNLGWADLLHPDDRQPFLDKFFHAFKNKESYSGEFRILNKEGNYSWLYAQVQVRLHPNGSYAGHISSCIDITKRKQSEEDIKRFKFMADNASEPFILMKKDGTFEYLNKAALEKWGYTAEEAKNLRVPDVDPIYNDEVFAKIFAKAQIDDIPIFETLHKKKDGNIYPVEVNMGAFQIAGTPYLFAVARDISERKKAEEAVKESEQRLRSLVEGAPFPIGVYTGREMRIQFVNQSILDVWGKGRDVIGKKFADVLPELQGTGLYESLDKVFSTGIAFHEHNRPIYLTAFGKDPHYFNYSFTALYDASGKIYGVLNTAAEVTEMEIARQKVEESEERFRNVANSAPVLIWMADKEKLRYFFNKGWLNFTGRIMEQESGNGWIEVVHPEDVQKCMDIYFSSFDKREPFYMEYRLKRHDGIYRWLSDNGVPRFTPDGQFEGYIGACMDIDEQKKAEEQFRVLADQAPMWVWLTDKEVNILYTNPEVLSFLGIAHYTEFTGRLWEQKVHPDDIAMVYTSFSDAASLQQSFSFEFRVLSAKTQQYEWFYIKAVPRLESGDFTGFIGTGININEQKLILSQLEYRKALLEAHNESSLDGILLVDTKGKILSYNHRFVEIWNMQQQIVEDKDDEAALAFAVTQLVNPEQFMNRVRWMYKNSKEIIIDELEFKDGKIIERHGYHVAGADGSYYGCSWMFRDITGQRKYERAVKESEVKFRLLADSMPQHIWTSDTEGNLNYYNQSVFDYSGLNLEQINKDGWIQIVHPDDREENIKQWFHAISTGKGFLFEHRFRRYDGEYRWQLSRAIPQRDETGKIQMWVGTSTDIQDQKTREEKKDEFISIASHEMKTPLTTAKAYLQMLELILDKNNEDASLYAKKANQSVNRLNELISELLDVSKIRLGKLNYNVTTFNFNDMIESTVENMQLTSPTHRIIKSGKVNDSVTGDKDRLQQVVINLLTNAIKYSPGAEKVFVNAEQDNNSITVSVKDTGIGIAQQSLNKIFEKYHRVEEHAVHFQGLGIGLFISYEIIQRHHGRLWAESEPGKGSTFYFSIPVNCNL